MRNMTRINPEGDIEWYGVDKKGNIAVFCSAGRATVPESVLFDEEKYEKLINLFGKLPCISDTYMFQALQKELFTCKSCQRFF